jgi:hypothetical protein
MNFQIDPNKKILLDADVIIHFYVSGFKYKIHTIFDNQLYILDLVYNEIRGEQRQYLNSLINQRKIIRIRDHEIEDENYLIHYISLTTKFGIGRGESACLAYCRCYDDAIASSNFKDVKSICDSECITLISTMDFLITAFEKKAMSRDECDHFVECVLQCGSKLPYTSFSAYLVKIGHPAIK